MPDTVDYQTVRHMPDCSLVTTHHLTCSCGAYAAVSNGQGNTWNDQIDARTATATAEDLHARVTAAIQQRLDLARAATQEPWDVHIGPTAIRSSIPYAWVMVDQRRPILERQNGGTIADVEHAAANDPAAVISLCEAALRIVGRHTRDEWGYCTRCASRIDGSDVQWPCTEFKDQAAAFRVEVSG